MATLSVLLTPAGLPTPVTPPVLGIRLVLKDWLALRRGPSSGPSQQFPIVNDEKP